MKKASHWRSLIAKTNNLTMLLISINIVIHFQLISPYWTWILPAVLITWRSCPGEMTRPQCGVPFLNFLICVCDWERKRGIERAQHRPHMNSEQRCIMEPVSQQQHKSNLVRYWQQPAVTITQSLSINFMRYFIHLLETVETLLLKLWIIII